LQNVFLQIISIIPIDFIPKDAGTTTQHSKYQPPEVEADKIGSDLDDDDFSSGSGPSRVSIQSTITYDNRATPSRYQYSTSRSIPKACCDGGQGLHGSPDHIL
jgi:hypothetical protein